MARSKAEALQIALERIEKSYGKGTIMRLGKGACVNVEAISTTCPSLDMALGIGGLPRGRITEIYGPESSGKTTVALHVVAQAQKEGGTAAFIDVEHAIDPIYATAIGVDLDELLLSQPDNGEQALDVVDELVSSGAVDVIVIDSVAALVPKAELEGDIGDAHIGLQDRLMSQSMRILAGKISKTNTCVIFINQIRAKVGMTGYGPRETTCGGRSLKFYASVRLDIRRIQTLKKGGDALGNRTRVKVVKNKCAPPLKEAEFDIVYGQGISREGSILDLATDAGIISKSGAWYSYNDDRWQGQEAVKDFLRENPEIAAEIEKEIKNMA